MTLSWTQPICDRCWLERNGERVPARVKDLDVGEGAYQVDRCAYCGADTNGIYVRDDPASVKYPRPKD